MSLTVGRPVLPMVGLTTALVAADVAVPDAKPVLLAVTRTRSTLPSSAGATVYPEPVAPGMSTPSAVHWRVNDIPDVSDQVPFVEVSAWPTSGVESPMVGRALLVIGGWLLVTEAVSAEVATPSAEFVRDAVTRTEIFLPASPGCTTYVGDTAPAISAPSASHW